MIKNLPVTHIFCPRNLFIVGIDKICKKVYIIVLNTKNYVTYIYEKPTTSDSSLDPYFLYSAKAGSAIRLLVA